MTAATLNSQIDMNGAVSFRSLRPLRVAVLCDFREENWPSMDLVGDMLVGSLVNEHQSDVQVEQVLPQMPQPFGKNRAGSLKNAHRVIGRFFRYPREIRRLRDRFDLFHIIDHSYAHLALELPPGRVLITCHDLDAFAAVQSSTPKSLLGRAIAKRLLRGMQSAAWIVCPSHATRHELLEHQFAQADRTSVIHNGVHPDFNPDPNPTIDAAISRLLNSGESPEVLHVGSTVRRKRIEDVLGIFAKLRARIPKLRLLRVGGVFTNEQQRLARDLGVAASINVLPHIDAAHLAAVYRRARLIIQPSESEGFGLPVIEAMACGTPVIASDIPALREVGGNATEYCAVGNVAAFSERAFELLHESPSSRENRRRSCFQQASRFSWTKHAAQVAQLYREVLAW